MRLAMELHGRGWQVYRAYIDEKFDFVIMKTWCTSCKEFRKAWIKQVPYKQSIRKVVSNLCENCHKDSLRMVVRFIQVKTSEGKLSTSVEHKTFSFHPKIRYHLADGRIFYVWIQVWDSNNVNYFIFNTDQVTRFDNIGLPTYQVTDNQKTSLRITKEGEVLNRSDIYDYEVFPESLNNFEIFNELDKDEFEWRPIT